MLLRARLVKLLVKLLYLKPLSIALPLEFVYLQVVTLELGVHEGLQGVHGLLLGVLRVTLKQGCQVGVDLYLVHLLIWLELRLMKDILAVNGLFKALLDYGTNDIAYHLIVFLLHHPQRLIPISEFEVEHLSLDLEDLVLELLVLELLPRRPPDDPDKVGDEPLLLGHGGLHDEGLALGVLDALGEGGDVVLDQLVLALHLLDLVVLVLHDLAQVHRLFLEPLQRLLQGTHSIVKLHLELLFSDGFLDEKKFLLNSQHVTLKEAVSSYIDTL